MAGSDFSEAVTRTTDGVHFSFPHRCALIGVSRPIRYNFCESRGPTWVQAVTYRIIRGPVRLTYTRREPGRCRLFVVEKVTLENV